MSNYVTAIKRANKPYSNAITHLLCHTVDSNNRLNQGISKTRVEVINLIENKHNFKTLLESNGQYKFGDDISIVIIQSKKYLRTDGNRIEADNLGELPEF